MEADFSGYATKAGLKCTDGRTILAGAFKHQDKTTVPLVWQHGHNDPQNVLGHVQLEDRADGVYAYGFFNDTERAAHARSLLEHNDISMMSIWANDLIERSKRVLHGAIREVSLVLSGANPGAVIENVTIRHDDGDDLTLEDEVIIRTGLTLSHSSKEEKDMTEEDEDMDIQDIIDTMNEEQQELLHFMVGEALSHAAGDDLGDDATVKDVYDSMTEQQKTVVHFMIGEALAQAEEKGAKHSNLDNQEGNEMGKYNVFEKSGGVDTPVLSHSEINGIVADATKRGSLKDAVEEYALAHGINDIDVLFPDAQALDKEPEFLKRRPEWVNHFLGGTRKSPFARIKTLSADITMDQARAKGYVTGAMKKEEFFTVSKRITTPTTIYKKQALDRDDMIDITDFDVVTWLKGEMRMMLDEEVARAALIGDGRDISHEDKISESNIRPIANDHELYATTVNVNIDDANSSVQEIIDAIVSHRRFYKGTGMPAFYTTETYISKFLLLKDTLGRRIYKNLDELASELRVSSIVPVEVMEEVDDLIGVMVNPTDYVMGADKGGQVSMFDDFDIDYNKYKYLIETRLSGALTKMKGALVVRKVAANLELVTPAKPAFDGSAITITDQTGVIYQDASDDSVMNAAGSPYAVAVDETFVVNAFPDTGYYFASTAEDSWTFVGE